MKAFELFPRKARSEWTEWARTVEAVKPFLGCEFFSDRWATQGIDGGSKSWMMKIVRCVACVYIQCRQALVVGSSTFCSLDHLLRMGLDSETARD